MGGNTIPQQRQRSTETELTNAVNRTQKASVVAHGPSAVLTLSMSTYANREQRYFGAKSDDYSGNGECVA